MCRFRLLRRFLSSVLGAITATGALTAAMAAPLSVSNDGHYLVTEDGEPFFWLGDTAWELFHRLTYDEAIAYLDDRAARGFTVIQAVALAEQNGLTEPTPAGYLPLENNDPARPFIIDGPDNDYWDHVDRVIDAANERGLIIALLPTWGDKWNLKWGAGPVVFTPENTRTYGEWIGGRYAGKDVIWVLGGDRNPETDEHLAITDAMAAGIEASAGTDALMTFHPMGGSGSSDFFAGADWLDFHFRQNGHRTEYRDFARTLADYQRIPAKPVVEGEPLYEGHPVKFDADLYGYSLAADVRRPLYWNLFNGAAGHTYGHHAIWQMASDRYHRVNNPLVDWRDALPAPGGDDMRHAKALLMSRPGWETRRPALDVIETGPIAQAIPGEGTQRMVATQAADRSWAMVYMPVSRPVTIPAATISGDEMRVWLFDPRTGDAADLGAQATGQPFVFTPDEQGEYLDFVLVLDDAAQAFPAPGKVLDFAGD